MYIFYYYMHICDWSTLNKLIIIIKCQINFLELKKLNIIIEFYKFEMVFDKHAFFFGQNTKSKSK